MHLFRFLIGIEKNFIFDLQKAKITPMVYDFGRHRARRCAHADGLADNALEADKQKDLHSSEILQLLRLVRERSKRQVRLRKQESGNRW